MQVVVIENRQEERQRITGYVERLELEACQAFPSFDDAIAYLEHEPVDVVLLNADGKDLPWTERYRKIKLIDQGVKVVLMSQTQTSAVKAYELGIYDYLLKPVKRKQLERVVEKARDG